MGLGRQWPYYQAASQDKGARRGDVGGVGGSILSRGGGAGQAVYVLPGR